jgi:hypothetical protein
LCLNKNKFTLVNEQKYKFHDNDKLYFISFAVINWIDVFIREEYKEELIKSWKYCIEHKGLQIYGWCIMTSHVHMIVGTVNKSLDDIVGEIVPQPFIVPYLSLVSAAVWSLTNGPKLPGNFNSQKKCVFTKNCKLTIMISLYWSLPLVRDQTAALEG